MGTLRFTPSYSINLKLLFLKKVYFKTFIEGIPCGPVVRTLHLLCRKHGFSPGQGTKILLCDVVKKTQK